MRQARATAWLYRPYTYKRKGHLSHKQGLGEIANFVTFQHLYIFLRSSDLLADFMLQFDGIILLL